MICVKWHCAVSGDLGWLHISFLFEKLLSTESWPVTLLSLFETERGFPFRSAERLANCSFRVVTVSAGSEGNAWNIAVQYMQKSKKNLGKKKTSFLVRPKTSHFRYVIVFGISRTLHRDHLLHVHHLGTAGAAMQP